MLIAGITTVCMLLPAARLHAGASQRVPESLLADRRAIEAVYHAHRHDPKPAFEDVLPPAKLERLVRRDLCRQALLRTIYRETLTEEDVQKEIERIHRTTRAPGILEEIMAALDHDPQRLARAFIRPRLVARRLRSRFVNDTRMHAEGRRQADAARAALLTGNDTPAAALFTTVTWQLHPPPDHTSADPRADRTPRTRETRATSMHYASNARAQIAHPTRPVEGEPDTRPRYFSGLPPDLQRLLLAQLREPGSVSAVVESDLGFSVYQLESLTKQAMTVSAYRVPKKNFDTWLAEQCKQVRLFDGTNRPAPDEHPDSKTSP